MAMGTKSIPAVRSEYFARFLSSAVFAAEPAETLDIWICEFAKVSGQVASHARQRPFFHGTVVTPSGRFAVTLALLHNPTGSRVARTPTPMKARWIMSLIWLWRDCRPALFLQERPWWPSNDTIVPQQHWWGCTRGVPSLRPTAIRTDESSSFRPIEAIGNASSQSPEPSAIAANSLALSMDPLFHWVDFPISICRWGRPSFVAFQLRLVAKQCHWK